MRRTALAEGIAALTAKPVLHGDNGATLKATTVLAMLKLDTRRMGQLGHTVGSRTSCHAATQKTVRARSYKNS